jgi:hypothetical protein
MRRSLKQRRLVTLAVLVVLLVLVVEPQVPPRRSVASFCSAYKQQNDKLNVAYGSTYSTSVFSHGSNNPRDLLTAFTKLDRVAPPEIEPDVNTLKGVFQSISASLSGLSAETSLVNWTKKNCGK